MTVKEVRCIEKEILGFIKLISTLTTARLDSNTVIHWTPQSLRSLQHCKVGLNSPHHGIRKTINTAKPHVPLIEIWYGKCVYKQVIVQCLVFFLSLFGPKPKDMGETHSIILCQYDYCKNHSYEIEDMYRTHFQSATAALKPQGSPDIKVGLFICHSQISVNCFCHFFTFLVVFKFLPYK